MTLCNAYSYTRCSTQYVLCCHLIINHGNSTTTRQGLQVCLLVSLSKLPVAPLPAGEDYTLRLSPHNSICLSSLLRTVTLCNNRFTFCVICCIFSPLSTASTMLLGLWTHCIPFLYPYCTCTLAHPFYANSSVAQRCVQTY